MDLGAVRHEDVSMIRVVNERKFRAHRTKRVTYLPSGENLMSRTGFLKLK